LRSIIEQPTLELPHLGFRRYLSHPHLRLWVQHYWTAQQYNLPNTGFIETLYPDGGASLIFSFTHAFPFIEFKTKQTTSKIVIQQAIDSIGIRFHPGGIFKLFSLEMNGLSFADKKPEIPSDELNNIQDKLAEVQNHSTRLLVIEQWLLNKCYQRNLHPSLLQYFVPQLLSSTIPLNELIENQSISRRQLERKFQQEIGLSPAQLKQLLRIKQARAAISQNPSRPSIDVALDCGFYDQAHFIHQFQKITGQTPGQYKQRKMSQIYNPLP
jgi:AraC-like DNA-binding protein